MTISNMDLEFLRDHVTRFLDSCDWSNALFWSDKLITLSDGSSRDLLPYVQCLIETKQYVRALCFLKRPAFLHQENSAAATKNHATSMTSSSVDPDRPIRIQQQRQRQDDDRCLLDKHKLFKFLAVKCYLGTKQYEEAIKLAESVLDETLNDEIIIASNNKCKDEEDRKLLDAKYKEWRLDAAFYLLLGRAYEDMDNRQQAKLAYEKCLRADFYNFEALHRLIKRHLLTNKEKAELIDNLLSSSSTISNNNNDIQSHSSDIVVADNANNDNKNDNVGGGARSGNKQQQFSSRDDDVIGGGAEENRRKILKFVYESILNYNDDNIAYTNLKAPGAGRKNSAVAMETVATTAATSAETVAMETNCDDADDDQDQNDARRRRKNLSAAESPAEKLSRDNLTILSCRAEFLYKSSNFTDSYRLTSKILKSEQFRPDCLLTHVCLLVQLEKINELYKLAHRLVDNFPDSHVSWYAVACYYAATNQIEQAKRFYHKSTQLDPQFGEGWIGYGHAFAREQEHDQAMNCYVKAAKLMTSSHVPLLYVGLEYASTNNLKLGAKFLHEALQMAPNDPQIMHEMGVLMYRQENFAEAETYFRSALTALSNRYHVTPSVEKIDKFVTTFNGKDEKSLSSNHMVPASTISNCIAQSWEPLLNNLGHTLRKLKRYDEALQCHWRALRLKPRDPSTLSAIGYCYMFMDRFDQSIDYFHQSLSQQRDDSFVASMLSRSMELTYDLGLATSGAEFPDPPKFAPPVGGGGGTFEKAVAMTTTISTNQNSTPVTTTTSSTTVAMATSSHPINTRGRRSLPRRFPTSGQSVAVNTTTTTLTSSSHASSSNMQISGSLLNLNSMMEDASMMSNVNSSTANTSADNNNDNVVSHNNHSSNNNNDNNNDQQQDQEREITILDVDMEF